MDMASIGGPYFWSGTGVLGLRPSRWGVSDPLETRPSPTSVTTTNLVVLGQTAGAEILRSRDPLENFDPSRTAFQGRSKSND